MKIEGSDMIVHLTSTCEKNIAEMQLHIEQLKSSCRSNIERADRFEKMHEAAEGRATEHIRKHREQTALNGPINKELADAINAGRLLREQLAASQETVRTQGTKIRDLVVEKEGWLNEARTTKIELKKIMAERDAAIQSTETIRGQITIGSSSAFVPDDQKKLNNELIFRMQNHEQDNKMIVNQIAAIMEHNNAFTLKMKADFSKLKYRVGCLESGAENLHAQGGDPVYKALVVKGKKNWEDSQK